MGFDHIYIAVADLERSRDFYDRVFSVLGFRQNSFDLGGDAHVQYYNRHFGYVLRPARDSTRGGIGLHHLCFRVNTAVDVERCAAELIARGIAASAQNCIRSTPPTTWPRFSPTRMGYAWKSPTGVPSVSIGTITGKTTIQPDQAAWSSYARPQL